MSLVLAVSSKERTFQNYMQELEATIFFSEKELPYELPSNEMFWGLLRKLQQSDLFYFSLFILFTLISLLFLYKKFPEKVYPKVCIGALFIFSSILSFKCLEGWDELYIGLKHVYSMVNAHKYSYTLGSMQEANVDFLPIFITGILGIFGAPLLETYLSLGLLGNLWLLIIVWKIINLIVKDQRVTFIFTSGIIFLPCVLLSSVSGFFTTIFASAILTSLYLVILNPLEKNFKYGIFLLSILTLFRTEGIFLAFLYWIYFLISNWREVFQKEKRILIFKRIIGVGTLLAVPFLISAIVRYYYFGHIVPTPIYLKNTGGDISYIIRGFEYLRTVAYQYLLIEILLVGLTLFLLHLAKGKFDILIKLLLCWILITFFSIPYLIGGGDWFPVFWARYLIPWVIFTILINGLFIFHYFTSFAKKNTQLPFLVIFTFIFAPYFVQNSIFDRFLNPNAYITNLGNLDPNIEKWERIDKLGIFGKFLEKTTLTDSKIGSSEEATIMFYAKRDAVDFIGFAAHEVAFSKVNPYKPADLWHRKRNVLMPFKYRPEIIAFWEMSYIPKSFFETEDKDKLLESYLNVLNEEMFSEKRLNTAYYRAGSYEYLQMLGYRFIVVGTRESLFFYWIHENILNDHLIKMKELNFTEIKRIKISYKYNKKITDKFSSGLEHLN